MQIFTKIYGLSTINFVITIIYLKHEFKYQIFSINFIENTEYKTILSLNKI